MVLAMMLAVSRCRFQVQTERSLQVTNCQKFCMRSALLVNPEG
jgi:hypothetical protein